MVELLTTVDTDVPNAEFPVADGLPLALDLEDHGKHVGVGVLALAVVYAIVVLHNCGQLRSSIS
jgi:hypothetical protein